MRITISDEVAEVLFNALRKNIDCDCCPAYKNEDMCKRCTQGGYIPSVTVRQTGEWIRKHDSIVNAWFWECNKCECGFQQKYNFCPNCGRRMTGGLSKNSQQKQCLKQDLNKEQQTGKCSTCKHYMQGERDGSCDSYVCQHYSDWEGVGGADMRGEKHE